VLAIRAGHRGLLIPFAARLPGRDAFQCWPSHHRGASGYAPEDTMAAFRRAVSQCVTSSKPTCISRGRPCVCHSTTRPWTARPHPNNTKNPRAGGVHPMALSEIRKQWTRVRGFAIEFNRRVACRRFLKFGVRRSTTWCSIPGIETKRVSGEGEHALISNSGNPERFHAW